MSQVNTNQDFDYGESGSPEVMYDTGMRRITYYNKDTDWHEKTDIERGGFGIDVKDGVTPPAFGRIQKIRHQGKPGQSEVSVDTMISTSIEVAIIGASPAFANMYPDGNIFTPRPVPVDRWFKTIDTEVARTTISLFVVFRCDPEHKLWELPVKTFNVDNAIMLLNQVTTKIKALRKEAARVSGKNIPELMRYSMWVTLGCGETIKVGGEQKGNCTKIEIKWPKEDMTDADLLAMRVSPQDYAKFHVMRAELDSMFLNGFRQPITKPELLEAAITAYRERTLIAPLDDKPQLTAGSGVDYSDDAKRRAAAQMTDEDENKRRRIEAARNAAGSKLPDVDTVNNAKWPLVSFIQLSGETWSADLLELISIATGNANFSIEDAFAVHGISNLKEIPFDMTVAAFLKGVQDSMVTKS